MLRITECVQARVCASLNSDIPVDSDSLSDQAAANVTVAEGLPHAAAVSRSSYNGMTLSSFHPLSYI